MSEVPFDPYQEWLQIDTGMAPLNYYSLLGLAPFTGDQADITAAADERMAVVRRHHLGQRGDLSQQVLNQIAAAKVTLCNPQARSQYDEQLKVVLRAAAEPVDVSDLNPVTDVAIRVPTHALPEETSVGGAGFAGFDQADAGGFANAGTPAIPAAPQTAPTPTSDGAAPVPVTPTINPLLARFLNAYLVPIIWSSALFALAAVFMLLLFRDRGPEGARAENAADANVNTEREIVVDQRTKLNLPAGVALQRDDGHVELDITAAQLGGGAKLLSGEGAGDQITGLTAPTDTIIWEFHILKPGIFRPKITYACDGASAGGEFKLTSGPAKQWTRVHNTGGWDKFVQFDANKFLMLKERGRHQLTISAAEVPGAELMRVQSLTLERDQSGTMQKR